MALGIIGTGPYGRIRSLRQEINGCNYELEHFTSKSPRSKKRKRLEGAIADCRAEIRSILNRKKKNQFK